MLEIIQYITNDQQDEYNNNKGNNFAESIKKNNNPHIQTRMSFAKSKREAHEIFSTQTKIKTRAFRLQWIEGFLLTRRCNSCFDATKNEES